MSEEFEKKLNELYGETFRDTGERFTVYCNNADKHGHPLGGTEMRRVDSTLTSRGGLDEPIFIYNYHCDCGAKATVIYRCDGAKATVIIESYKK